MDLHSEAEVERALKLDKDYMGKSFGTRNIVVFEDLNEHLYALLPPSVQRNL